MIYHPFLGVVSTRDVVCNGGSIKTSRAHDIRGMLQHDCLCYGKLCIGNGVWSAHDWFRYGELCIRNGVNEYIGRNSRSRFGRVSSSEGFQGRPREIQASRSLVNNRNTSRDCRE
jgi:hypothetical protein